MKKPPYYKWCPAERKEIKEMSDAIELSYRRLWDYHCENDGLPFDLDALAAVCRSPAPEFKKTIWPKLEGYLYESGEKYRIRALEKQLKDDKDYRKSQSIKAKSMQEKKKREKPEVSHGLSDSQPERPNEQFIVKSAKPKDSRSAATVEPEIIENRFVTDIASNHQAVAEPELSQIDAELEPPEIIHHIGKVPELTETPPIEPEPNTGLPPESNNAPRETPVIRDESLKDNYFDPLETWEEFASLYPENGLVENKDAYWLFEKEIVSANLYGRLLRSLENYREKWAELGLQDFDSFMDWFGQWKAWEDSK